MTRTLRYLLVVVFLPVTLILTATTPADAVTTTYGDVKRGTVKMSGWVPYSDSACSIAARYAVSEGMGPPSPGQKPRFERIKATIKCSGQFNSIFTDLPGGGSYHDNNTTVTWEGTDLRTQADCELWAESSASPQGGLQDGVDLLTGQYGYEEVGGCQVDRVCLAGRYVRDMPFAPDATYNVSGCADFTMGALPLLAEERESCASGNPEFASLSEWDNPQWADYHQHHFVMKMKADHGSTRWSVVPVVGPIGVSKETAWGSRQFVDLFDTSATNPGWVTPTEFRRQPTNLDSIQSGEPNTRHQIVGVQVFLYGSGVQSDRYGMTEPALCNFWIGPKVLDRSTDTKDDPWLALDTPAAGGTNNADDTTVPDEPPTENSCNFSFADPSSWASGGICAVVGLLGKIWDVLNSVLSAVLGIPAAILGGLADLFVPDQGALDGAVADVSDSFDDTAPGQWSEAITGQSFTGQQSGCAGPTIAFDTDMASVNMQPFNACSGIMATVAGICKLVLSAGLVFGGAMACLRALGSGFGWNPSVGEKV